MKKLFIGYLTYANPATGIGPARWEILYEKTISIQCVVIGVKIGVFYLGLRCFKIHQELSDLIHVLV
ncbi:MAG: hypothetical protein AAGA77_19455 [Bacteroidota bacterium]